MLAPGVAWVWLSCCIVSGLKVDTKQHRPPPNNRGDLLWFTCFIQYEPNGYVERGCTGDFSRRKPCEKSPKFALLGPAAKAAGTDTSQKNKVPYSEKTGPFCLRVEPKDRSASPKFELDFVVLAIPGNLLKGILAKNPSSKFLPGLNPKPIIASTLQLSNSLELNLLAAYSAVLSASSKI